MKLRCICILFLLLCVPVFYGQNDLQIIPLTPTSSVFRQFAGYEPSLATGTVDVPIPLYEIKVGNFVLPFSLRYYTSGIKVMDSPYPMGYGWQFHPGLRITRTVRGRSDGRSLFPMRNKTESDVYNMSEDERFYYLRSLLKEIIDYSNPANSNCYDGAYDIFTINLPSGNYCFIVKDGQAMTCGNLLQIKLWSDNQNISGFKVTDENGIIYHFGKESRDNNIYQYVEVPQDSNYDYTAWMLRKITFPNNQSEIEFVWEQSNFQFGLTNQAYEASAPWTLDYDGHLVEYTGYDIGSIPYTPGHEEYITQFFQNIIDREPIIFGNNKYTYDLRLKQVRFPLGVVTLNYQSPLLQSFQVQDLSNNVIKQVDFSYGGYLNTLLTSLQFSDEGIYRFSYNAERFLYFTGQDYWGYYNGKPNGSFIPKMTRKFWNNTIVGGGGNRHPDSDKMQANMLVRVDYPTGGFTQFEYEPHRFEEPTPIHTISYTPVSYGRGLRVSRIITQSSTDSEPSIKRYLYGKSTPGGFNTNGLGHINILYSTLDLFWDSDHFESIYYVPSGGGDVMLPYSIAYKKVYLNSKSLVEGLFTTTPPVCYSYVTEIVTTGTDTKGLKTEYTFSYPLADEIGGSPASMTTKFFVRHYRYLFSKAIKLLNRKIYSIKNNEYVPIESVTYSYIDRFENRLEDLYVCRQITQAIQGELLDFASRSRLNLKALAGQSWSFDPYYYVGSYITFEYTEPESETRIEYMENGEIRTKIQTRYLNNTLLLSKEQTNGDGTQIKEKHDYLKYGNAYYAYPTLSTWTVNGVSRKTQTSYYYNKFLADRISLYNDKSDYSSGIQTLFQKYDAYDNPVWVSKRGDFHTVYIWGYRGQYPIAEIKNAVYNEITALIPQTTLNEIAKADTPTQAHLQQINELRFKLPKAQISTYTYKPLIGMTSATDPSGITTFYDYHVDGRLKEVYLIKDGVKTSLKRHEYYLKNSTTP